MQNTIWPIASQMAEAQSEEADLDATAIGQGTNTNIKHMYTIQYTKDKNMDIQVETSLTY